MMIIELVSFVILRNWNENGGVSGSLAVGGGLAGDVGVGVAVAVFAVGAERWHWHGRPSGGLRQRRQLLHHVLDLRAETGRWRSVRIGRCRGGVGRAAAVIRPRRDARPGPTGPAGRCRYASRRWGLIARGLAPVAVLVAVEVIAQFGQRGALVLALDALVLHQDEPRGAAHLVRRGFGRQHRAPGPLVLEDGRLVTVQRLARLAQDADVHAVLADDAHLGRAEVVAQGVARAAI